MMARSINRSNQRPDTLMQDRKPDRRNFLRRTAGPYSRANNRHMRCSKIGAYSITSSASAKSFGESWILSAFAVFRLMTNSNLVGCCTGSSAG